MAAVMSLVENRAGCRYLWEEASFSLTQRRETTTNAPPLKVSKPSSAELLRYAKFLLELSVYAIVKDR